MSDEFKIGTITSISLLKGDYTVYKIEGLNPFNAKTGDNPIERITTLEKALLKVDKVLQYYSVAENALENISITCTDDIGITENYFLAARQTRDAISDVIESIGEQ